RSGRRRKRSAVSTGVRQALERIGGALRPVRNEHSGGNPADAARASSRDFCAINGFAARGNELGGGFGTRPPLVFGRGNVYDERTARSWTRGNGLRSRKRFASR